MNSFSYDLKKEVAQIEVEGDEAISELSALIRTSGEITKNGSSQKLLIFTELPEVADRVYDIIKEMYGVEVEKNEVENLSFSKNQRIEIVIPSSITKQVLIDAEVAKLDEDKFLVYEPGISQYMITEEEQARAYLRGAFLGAFSCGINFAGENNLKHSSGYHAEFVFTKQEYAQDFCFLLADFDIISKMMQRNSSFVVYVKGLEMISDLLALVGASKGVLKLQNEGVFRSIRNNVNRQNNCVSGNLTKTVEASVREIEAINIIKDNIGLENLEPALQEVAYLRLANPEESLDELVKLSTTPISKSGLYHRLKKLEKIANEI